MGFLGEQQEKSHPETDDCSWWAGKAVYHQDPEWGQRALEAGAGKGVQLSQVRTVDATYLGTNEKEHNP